VDEFKLNNLAERPEKGEYSRQFGVHLVNIRRYLVDTKGDVA
jgi:hypothetical protein